MTGSPSNISPHSLAITPSRDSSSNDETKADEKLNDAKADDEEDAQTQPLTARGIAFPDDIQVVGHQHVGGTGIFPRTGTKELRRELTLEQKELSSAAHAEAKPVAAAKSVDIVSPSILL